ncbi:hypothetical protein [Gloeobacter morelensis]|uniref:Uncharacterized protein n=1 Tax=Gloeobacter morelensis MG652769 TaxID=2781736 RepID=A0ABY3PLD5_9CYAN|nr:hypothetical protein [Gloeobacter morelensis]UFP94463.1 hypothetical protein ISF26_22425 [Gloeobacter morelensis MG652769]
MSFFRHIAVAMLLLAVAPTVSAQEQTTLQPQAETCREQQNGHSVEIRALRSQYTQAKVHADWAQAKALRTQIEALRAEAEQQHLACNAGATAPS